MELTTTTMAAAIKAAKEWDYGNPTASIVQDWQYKDDALECVYWPALSAFLQYAEDENLKNEIQEHVDGSMSLSLLQPLVTSNDFFDALNLLTREGPEGEAQYQHACDYKGYEDSGADNVGYTLLLDIPSIRQWVINRWETHLTKLENNDN